MPVHLEELPLCGGMENVFEAATSRKVFPFLETRRLEGGVMIDEEDEAEGESDDNDV